MDFQHITSESNINIKEVRSLHKKKYREKTSLFFVEGLKFVMDAFFSGVKIKSVFYSESFAESKLLNHIKSHKKYNISLFKIPDKLFTYISDTDNPQGILAVIKMKKYVLYDLFDNTNLFVIADSIRDPGNMGTILRTAEAAGFSGVLLTPACVDIYNPKVVRATAGSIFHIPSAYCSSVTDLILRLKSRGIKIYASHAKGKIRYFDADMKKDVAIVIGNEADGISRIIKEEADMLVKIPMEGRAESLNASIAAGIMIYESLRQRKSF